MLARLASHDKPDLGSGTERHRRAGLGFHLSSRKQIAFVTTRGFHAKITTTHTIYEAETVSEFLPERANQYLY